MDYKKYFLLFISSLFLNLSFIYPHFLHFLVFFFLVPIFYLNMEDKISFKEGIFWGSCFYLGHFFYLLVLVLEKGSGCYRPVIWFFFVLYYIFLTGIWFLFKSWFASFLYFVYIYRYSFIILGRIEGYPILNLILPLAQHKSYLYFLPYFNSEILLIIIILLELNIALYFFYKKYKYIISSFLLAIPFLYGFFVKKKEYNHLDILNKTDVLVIEEKEGPWETMCEISEKLSLSAKNKPDLEVVIMPESSFPYPLNDYQRLIKMIYDNGFPRHVNLFIGSHRKEDNKVFNTIYHIKNGDIKNFYDKKHIMPFTENIPKLWRWNFLLKNIFLKDKVSFSVGNGERIVFKINKKLSFVPYICSELFFSQKINTGDMILFISNDSWFKFAYFRNLLFLEAVLISIENNVSILYVSHYKFDYIMI